MRGRTFEAAYLFISVISPGVLGAQHSTADQLCWPSSKVWAALSSSIDGQLVAPRPPGWAYHDPKYDEAACNDFQANWNNSFWRANQYGAMQNPIWDSLECNIGTPRNVTCDQGFVPHCSVDAHNDNHAAEAVKFADRYNLSLVIKNTGHDYLGRSSREGVYKVADAHNVSVVGGGARSVGAAGGWIQGGGHSPLGGLFGMGVDMVQGCPANASAGEIEQVGGDITQLVQQFGRLTGLDDAAYYNEAGPIKTRDSPEPRGGTDNAAEQKEKGPASATIQDLRAEFEQLFKAKVWRGVHNLPKDKNNRRALVIAINYGERRPPHRLYGTFVDALRIIRMLEKFEYKPGDICVLTDIAIPSSTTDYESDSSEGEDSESRLAKKVNIVKGLKWLASGGGPDKYRFLFFSGHGHLQRSKSSSTGACNQCIMPEDVKFQRLQSCSDCFLNHYQYFGTTGFALLLNQVQRLQRSLIVATVEGGPGTEIIGSAQPNSKGRVAHGIAGPITRFARAIEQECSPVEVKDSSQLEDIVMADSIGQTTEPSDISQTFELFDSSDSSVSPRQLYIGNFLGLPIEVDLVTGTASRVPLPRDVDLLQVKLENPQEAVYYTPEKPISAIKSPFLNIWGIGTRNESSTHSTEVPQLPLEFSCQRKGIAAAMRPFNDGCRIMCWAACRKLESALEDQRHAGRFTEAFTEFLTRPRIKEETQLPRSTEVLINYLGAKFNEYNEEARKNKWDEQHPKLFISANLQSGDYLKQELDV
ncbi:hypothetical protein RSOLAG22IIIB_04978 [Rhizoctonia solani]|uniref:Peptidase C14 caspase domain-containing protein n=1 Tax=Rhizoctonia solani TaxID=456999 RepID=A0A0K6G2R3_9AGAM|nr:hypothetical protein RSOLAG22IIIB_04978 [Rhizoctonia solani]